jgi:ABC-2 type transport system permease protein
MHKVWLITKREYLRTVKKKSFWLSTVLMPIFIVVVSLISGSSGQMMEDMVAQGANDLSRVLIMDGTGLLAPEGLPDNIVFVEDKAAAQEEVRSKAASAFIYIPSSILDSKGEIYTADSDLLSGDTLSNMVNNLLDSSVINSIEDPIKVQLLTTDITFDVTTLTENGDSEFNIANFIAPAVVVIVYILLISFGSSYLLLSVAEEKENRMIEIVMSLITPKELILGKLIGLLGVVLTQILVLTGMSIAGLMLVGTQIPLDMLSGIEISAGQILMSVFYLFAGFLILANTMVECRGCHAYI